MIALEELSLLDTELDASQAEARLVALLQNTFTVAAAVQEAWLEDDGAASGALAQNDRSDYQSQTGKLLLCTREDRGGQVSDGSVHMDLLLIGIGTGNPDHLTLQAIRALNGADLILIPRKGADKADLADLRRLICEEVLTDRATQVAEFDMPVRDAGNPSYLSGVTAWHDAIAECWTTAIDGYPGVQRVALMVWGDPALYDSTLRIADRLARTRPVRLQVIPGLMSPQLLTAAHGIPLNDLGAPFLVTTGRQLREGGWPAGVDTLVVMLDGDCAFSTLDPEGVSIWWGAYLGMEGQITESGPLSSTGPRIVAARAAARRERGWIMDTYLLRRASRSQDHSASAP